DAALNRPASGRAGASPFAADPDPAGSSCGRPAPPGRSVEVSGTYILPSRSVPVTVLGSSIGLPSDDLSVKPTSRLRSRTSSARRSSPAAAGYQRVQPDFSMSATDVPERPREVP